MKKFRSAFLFLLVLTGCGGSGGVSDRIAAGSPLVGNWRLTRVVGSEGAISLTLNCPGNIDVPTYGSATCSDHELISFRDDGTFTSSGALSISAPSLPLPTLPTNTSGTWSLVSGTLIVTPTGSAVGLNVSVAIDGNTATVTQTQVSGTATITGVGTLVRQ